MAFLAVDVGGTKLAVGIVDERGTVLSKAITPTPSENVWGALEELVIGQVRDANVEIVSCGVGCGGPMSPGGEDV